MAARRISMRKPREIIRLSVGGLGDRAVARTCNVSPSTVGNTVRAAKAADLYRWPLPELGNAELRDRLSGRTGADGDRPVPEFERIDTELGRKHVTLRLLWHDYRVAHPDGYGYSRFCELYRRWRRGPGGEVVMRFEHHAGETLFVDWAGSTVAYRDGGAECRSAVFVATFGASDYIYAGAYPDMTQDNWLQAHVDAFEYIGAVPEKVAPDSPRTAVSRASTRPEHMPAEHRAVMERTVEDYLRKARECGPNCVRLLETMLGNHPRPEMRTTCQNGTILDTHWAPKNFPFVNTPRGLRPCL